MPIFTSLMLDTDTDPMLLNNEFNLTKHPIILTLSQNLAQANIIVCQLVLSINYY